MTADSARERRTRPSPTTPTENRGKGVLRSVATDALNITIAVGMLVAVYWLVGQEFPGGTFGISVLLGGLIVLDAVATAYDVWFG